MCGLCGRNTLSKSYKEYIFKMNIYIKKLQNLDTLQAH